MSKVKITELKKIISGMVKEELNLLLKEEKENQVFNAIPEKDKSEFISWLMRYWFNPSKNSRKPWWPSFEITPDNILEFLSDLNNRFPLSPKQLVDDWFIKTSLAKKVSGKTGKELDSLAKQAEEEAEKEKTRKYVSGEETLKDIGQELGLTAAMINKLEQTGIEKIAKMVGAKNILDMDEDELDEILEKIDEIRYEMSFEFAKRLKGSNGDVRGFVESLVKDGILTPVDVRLMQPREIEMLMFLMNKDEEEIAEYLRGDAVKDDNKIKSFQSAVSKKVHLSSKRGRPRKELTDNPSEKEGSEEPTEEKEKLV